MSLKTSFARHPTSDTPRWYFAKFSSVPNAVTLSSHGIKLAPGSFISFNSYNLYLTPTQASYLLNAHVAELSELEDKFIIGDLPLSDAHHLLVEVSDDFDPADHSSSNLVFHLLSSTVYSVKSADLTRAVSYLRTLTTVYAVTPASRPDVMNHMSVGYTQSHTGALQDDFTFARPLHDRGIQGNGTVITVIDTPIDASSTFFYDDNPIGPTHRKLMYVHSFVQPMKASEHGTHVCGSLAGNSLDPEASRYNGMAPMAKIAHMPLEMANAMMRDLGTNMRSWGSHISTNSWGTAGYAASLVRAFDDWAQFNPDLTIVFSAGNDRSRDWARLGGYSSLGSPASCKNVLSIGSLGQLAVSNPPEDRDYLLSIADEDPVVGTTVFRAKLLPFSTDPFIGNTTRIASQHGHGKQCKVITNGNELGPTVSDPEHIRFVVTTVNIEQNDPAPFGVFWVGDPTFIEKNQSARTISVCQEFRTGNEFLGSFSSMGPSATGVVKPDVSAPGELILSARSSPLGPANHDINPLNLHLLSGTSMASPHVSGALALVEQWLKDEHHLSDPSSMLMRALAVTCAESLDPSQKSPDVMVGYGVLHLTKYLPMLGSKSNYRFVYVNSEFIPVPGHLVSTLSVAGKGSEIRITLTYLDVTVSADSRIPLFVDLDLIVVSPSGKIYRGNHYKGNHEEHFSTVERIILTPAEIEIGTYRVHVLALAPIDVPRVRFGVVAVGELSASAVLKFAEATTCLPCGHGVCNTKTKICDCSGTGRVGQNCQILPIVLKVGSDLESLEEEIGPLGVLHITFRNSDKKGATLGIHVHSVSSPVALRLFVGSLQHLGRIPAEYSEVIWDNVTKSQTWERDTLEDEVRMMIRNDFSEPRTYRAWVDPGSTWRILTIVLAAVGGVLIAAGVVVGIVCYFHRTRPKEDPSPIAIPE